MRPEGLPENLAPSPGESPRRCTKGPAPLAETGKGSVSVRLKCGFLELAGLPQSRRTREPAWAMGRQLAAGLGASQGSPSRHSGGALATVSLGIRHSGLSLTR